MALHLEDGGLAVADIDHTGILAWPLNDPWRVCRQFCQVHTRGLIRAMLAPHGREDSELGDIRLAPEMLQDIVILGFTEAVLERDLTH